MVHVCLQGGALFGGHGRQRSGPWSCQPHQSRHRRERADGPRRVGSCHQPRTGPWSNTVVRRGDQRHHRPGCFRPHSRHCGRVRRTRRVASRGCCVGRCLPLFGHPPAPDGRRRACGQRLLGRAQDDGSALGVQRLHRSAGRRAPCSMRTRQRSALPLPRRRRAAGLGPSVVAMWTSERRAQALPRMAVTRRCRLGCPRGPVHVPCRPFGRPSFP